jgi:predicted  nucleic acid-binding Zn-ribbon protein
MSYTTSLIETVAQCDTLLQEVNNELTNFTIRKANIEASITNNANSVALIPPQLANYNSQLAQRQTQLANAQNDDERRDINIEIYELSGRILRLEGRMEATDRLRVLDRQFELAKVVKYLDAMNEYIAELQTRKDELIATV